MPYIANIREMSDPTAESNPTEHALFTQIDVNKNGVLEKDEIENFCERMGEELIGRKLLGKLDENEDGKVDFTEFVKGFNKMKMFLGGIELKKLQTAIDGCWKTGSIPFVVDPSGKADTFLSYNGNTIDGKGLFVLDKIHKKKTNEEITEEARKLVVASIKFGQPCNLVLGKGAPALGEHISEDGLPLGLFKHGFTKDLGAVKKMLREVDDPDMFFPKGKWDDLGCMLVVSTQFDPDDAKEFLNGAWPDWPWDNFTMLVVKDE